MRYILGFAITVVGMAVALWVLGWGVRPDVGNAPRSYTAQQILDAQKARDVHFDADDAKRAAITVEVDYSQGKSAAWWPKGEAPVLAELVKQGKLPPVEQRVGPEPVVMRAVDGVTNYGGTWHRVMADESEIWTTRTRYSNCGLFRWSPLGYPIVPHLAKSIDISPDNRNFTITLRKGVRWSDGYPLTTDDIMYWWQYEARNRTVSDIAAAASNSFRSGGKYAEFTKIDDLTFRISFEVPNGRFLETLAGSYGMLQSPKHYLEKYHPELGDPKFIEAEMKAYQQSTPRTLYNNIIKQELNPELPRLWPWIPGNYRSSSPHVYVRNPYYYCVDEQGNQLPYLDRLQMAVRPQQTMSLSLANGETDMQERYVRFDNYTELMSRRDVAGTKIYHWYPATRQNWVINPNQTRYVDPNDPDTKWKAQLLSDKRFRQALSMAINRVPIIKVEYAGLTKPSQVEAGIESGYHNEKLANAFVNYNPAVADRLLDELKLDQRDLEGMRTFPDGSRMTFYLDITDFTGVGPAQLVVDDWAAVGVRCVYRVQNRPLFSAHKDGSDFDFNVWSSESEFFPLLIPRYFVPNDMEAFYAVKWGRWYLWNGFYGDESAKKLKNAEPPPADHPMMRSYQLYEQAQQSVDAGEQHQLMQQIFDIAAENLWSIGIADAPPQPVVINKDLMNVPRNAIYCVIAGSPGHAGMETWSYGHPNDSAGTVAETAQGIINPVKRPRTGESTASASQSTAGRWVSGLIRWGVIAAIVLAVALIGLRHPFVLRRLAIMVPMLLIISVIVFGIIESPPGDFLTSKLIQYGEAGDAGSIDQIDELRRMFLYDKPVYVRYAHWMGFQWFTTFSPADRGLLQGDLGRSMDSLQPVSNLVGDRIVLTILLSLGTILFTWSLAIPIGIFSAARQYSRTDYALTLVGFIGMSVPGFLLALVIMAMTGIGAGLFSPRFETQPEWDWAKVVDLMKHLWVPVVVIGVGGTAALIRVMRANLLDELRKPYVTTARAKGVRPIKLLLKYPVRVAINPFVSGIGSLFPQLISGGAIVSIVLSLPTIGPQLLTALFTQDMYFAGSLLMVLSLLGVIGTLVSDLLLLWLDPRIRYEGAAR